MSSSTAVMMTQFEGLTLVICIPEARNTPIRGAEAPERTTTVCQNIRAATFAEADRHAGLHASGNAGARRGEWATCMFADTNARAGWRWPRSLPRRLQRCLSTKLQR
jgi:hypothetical protein